MLNQERNWTKIVTDHPTSQLSIKAYCRKLGISTASFYQHRRRLRLTPVEATKKAKSPSFAEIKVHEDRPPAQKPKIRLHTPDGYILEVFL